MNTKRKEKVTDIAFFLILITVFSYFIWQLVYAQTIYGDRIDGYRSDIGAYMAYMLEGADSGYIISYPLFFWLGRLFNLFMPIDKAITWVQVLLNALSMIFTKYYFDKLVCKDKTENDVLYKHLIVSFITVMCFLLSMWWLPRFGKIALPFKYQAFQGSYSGNPWHNSTYIATRPFAIVAFFSFTSLLDSYEKKIDVKDAIVFTVSLLLTTLAKPSFTFVLVSTAGLVMAFKLIAAKFKNFKSTMLLTLCFVPTFIDLFYQFFMVFGEGNPTEEHGIGFGWFDCWKMFTDNVAAGIFYANAFALICLIWFARDLKKDCLYRFSLLMFIVSVLEAGLLYEKGERFVHFNFCWGYMHGIFFFEVATAIKLLQHTFSKKRCDLLMIVGWTLFLIHLVAGICYFKGMYYGLDYNTMIPCTWL